MRIMIDTNIFISAALFPKGRAAEALYKSEPVGQQVGLLINAASNIAFSQGLAQSGSRLYRSDRLLQSPGPYSRQAQGRPHSLNHSRLR